MRFLYGPFSGFAVLLLICAFSDAPFVRLCQPVLIACNVAGIAVGPTGFGLVAAHGQIDLLAQISAGSGARLYHRSS